MLKGGAAEMLWTTTSASDRFNGSVGLASAVRIDTGAGAGDILFTNDSPIDSVGEETDVTLRGGTGISRLNGDLGVNGRLGSLTVQAAGRVIFGEADDERSEERRVGKEGHTRSVELG